jgi:hypothetical protein
VGASGAARARRGGALSAGRGVQCLGGVLVRSSSLLLDKKMGALVRGALQGGAGGAGDCVAQHAVLHAFRLFLENEDARISRAHKARAAGGGAGGGEPERVSAVSSLIGNDLLPLILDSAFPPAAPHRPPPAAAGEPPHTPPGAARGAAAAPPSPGGGLAAERVRGEAVALIAVVLARGLTAPHRVAPVLVALSGWGDGPAGAAGAAYERALAKSRELCAPPILTDAVVLAHERARAAGALAAEGAAGGSDAAGAFSLARAFRPMAGRSTEVRQLVAGLLGKADDARLPYAERLTRMLFVARVVAALPFQSLDAPLYAVHLLHAQALTLGTRAVSGLKSLLKRTKTRKKPRSEEDGGAGGGEPADAAPAGSPGKLQAELEARCAEGMLVSVLLALAAHLRAQYGISDARQRNFRPDAPGASKAEKVAASELGGALPLYVEPLFAPPAPLLAQRERIKGEGGALRDRMTTAKIEGEPAGPEAARVPPAEGDGEGGHAGDGAEAGDGAAPAGEEEEAGGKRAAAGQGAAERSVRRRA